ncbi:MAG: hypothetical protein IKK58_04875 [Clostridia bacterium]|nr:hypothetical protein [Clostridia bacterium]
MSEMIQYKCPCCNGAIEFDSTAQKMKCPYCDTEFETETLKQVDEALSAEGDELDWASSEQSEWTQDGMMLYSCTSCGGELICHETTAATFCPFCNNPVILSGRLSGQLRPDLVIPFKLDKEAAKKALFAHLKGKTLLPSAFKDQNRIDEIKGVYVPFWLFNANAEAHMRYHATRVHTWSDSRYIYTKTSHYMLVRNGNLSFANIPVDGSSKMDDDLMESLEPFDFSQAVDFQSAYLAGYLADKYDVDKDACQGNANTRLKSSTEQKFYSTTAGYASVIPENTSVKLSDSSVRYALLPVWILNTTYKDKKYTFAMNGQTGKMVGDLPMDTGKFWGWLLGLTAGIAAVAFGLWQLAGLF